MILKAAQLWLMVLRKHAIVFSGMADTLLPQEPMLIEQINAVRENNKLQSGDVLLVQCHGRAKILAVQILPTTSAWIGHYDTEWKWFENAGTDVYLVSTTVEGKIQISADGNLIPLNQLICYKKNWTRCKCVIRIKKKTAAPYPVKLLIPYLVFTLFVIIQLF